MQPDIIFSSQCFNGVYASRSASNSRVSEVSKFVLMFLCCQKRDRWQFMPRLKSGSPEVTSL